MRACPSHSQSPLLSLSNSCAVSSEMLNMPIPQDIDPNAFEVLLRFLHCEQGTPLNLTLENVFNVHRVAEL